MIFTGIMELHYISKIGNLNFLNKFLIKLFFLNRLVQFDPPLYVGGRGAHMDE